MSQTLSSNRPEFTETAFFDETHYLARYPDIAAAIADGRLGSAREHYEKHGRAEGRDGGSFDGDFYLRCYKLAADEIRAGKATGPLDHYWRFGRARGYLPNPQAVRPDDAARPPRFGGCWTDRPDALDVLDGKIEIGLIRPDTGVLLRQWIESGFVILPQAVPARQIKLALADIDRAFAGQMADLLFECPGSLPEPMPWHGSFTTRPCQALDLHYFSKPVRELLFIKPIVSFLSLLFESHMLATETRSFLRGAAREAHQDCAEHAVSIPGQSAAVWIALEDVAPGAGEFFYYEGSHRLPGYRYAARFKSVAEGARLDPDIGVSDEIRAHSEALKRQLAEEGLQKTLFSAGAGDVVILHPDLVHGGQPISKKYTRRSLSAHYCPKRLVPLFAENTPAPLWEHDGNVSTTRVYAQ